LDTRGSGHRRLQHSIAAPLKEVDRLCDGSKLVELGRSEPTSLPCPAGATALRASPSRQVDYIEESDLDARLPVPQKDGRVVSPGLNRLWLAGPPHAHTLAVACAASGQGAIPGDQ
jgi:hypothetical protein